MKDGNGGWMGRLRSVGPASRRPSLHDGEDGAGPGAAVASAFDPRDALRDRIGSTALAFRGYNVTNLGRTAELLAQPAYAETVERHLRDASAVHAPSSLSRTMRTPPFSSSALRVW